MMKKQSILLVDDNQDTLKLMSDILAEKSLFVFTAKNGEEGLEVLKRQDVDVVVTDIMMPGMNGIEFSKLIRRRNIAVVMVTGHGPLDFTGKVEEICDCFIEKFDLTKSLYNAVLKARERHSLNLRELDQSLLVTAA